MTHDGRSRHAKGRDIYDLLWYLADPGWPAPNLVLLNNALQQTGWTGVVTADNWREIIAARLRELTWDRVRADVTPFLEAPTAALLTRENLLRLLGVAS